MASRRLMLFSFEMGYSYPLNEVANMLTRNNSERARFFIADYDDYHLDGYYCVIVTRNETVYSFETGQVEKKVVDRTVIIQYSIDTKNKTMLVCGASAIVNQFVTAMSMCLNNSVIIDAKAVDLKRFVFEIVDDQRFIVNRVKVTDVPIGGGILANCTIDISQYADASSFLKKHNENISQIGVSLLICDSDSENEEMISLSIYRSGNVVFHSSVDVFGDEWRDAIYMIWSR